MPTPEPNTELINPKTQPPARYVYSEANLALVGYYDAGYKRRRPDTTNPSKAVALPDGRTFKIVPTVEYGYPNTEDLDLHRAFEAVLLKQMERRDKVDEHGHTQRRPHLQLPITVSISELLRRAGRQRSARDVRAARDWVRRHTATTIEGTLKLAKPNEPAVSFSTHLFHESYLPNDQMKNGHTADTVMLWPSRWYLSNLAYNFTYLIDASFHEAIGRHAIAKNLYPILLAGFLATAPHPFKKSYRDTVALFAMPFYPNHRHRERQLTPSLQRLRTLHFLDHWTWTHRDDDSVIIYYAGEKARADIAAKRARFQLANHLTNGTPAPLPASTTHPNDDHAQAAMIDLLVTDLLAYTHDHKSTANWRYLATTCVVTRRPQLVNQAISETRAADLPEGTVTNKGAHVNARLRDLMSQLDLFTPPPTSTA